VESSHLSNDDYRRAAAKEPRFYQMWQQIDCNITMATHKNPSGCQSDLFPWVEVTIGAGNNGHSQPVGFNDQTTGEAGTAMEVYGTQQGSSPYFVELAHQHTLSDNFHQSVRGGTGANHIELF
jgi:phospholipase C